MKQGLEGHINDLKRANEEEAKVRLKFENRVNTVLAIYRNLESKVIIYYNNSMKVH